MIIQPIQDHARRIEHIDVWRCIAIGLVIVTHVLYFSHPWYKQVVPGMVWRLSPLGGLGVQLFFCISGFVICRGMMSENRRNGRVSMAAFYVRRAFRIFPPLLLYIAALGLLTAAGLIHFKLEQAVNSIAFLCNLHTLDCGWFVGHTWSLAFEEQFYLLFPILFLVLALARRRERLLAVAFALMVATVAVEMQHNERAGHYVSTFSFMVWGCIFALYWQRVAPLRAKVPFPVWLFSALALPAFHMVVVPDFLYRVVYPALGPVACCIVIFGTPADHPMVRRFFHNAKLQYVGRMSYAIYLWQQLAVADLGFASPLPTYGFILMVFVVAHLSFRYVEAPMIAMGAAMSSRLTNRRAAIAPGPSAMLDPATSEAHSRF